MLKKRKEIQSIFQQTLPKQHTTIYCVRLYNGIQTFAFWSGVKTTLPFSNEEALTLELLKDTKSTLLTTANFALPLELLKDNKSTSSTLKNFSRQLSRSLDIYLVTKLVPFSGIRYPEIFRRSRTI